MDCKEWQKTISAYVDGELDSEQVKQFREHLESCSRCQALVLAEKQTKEILQTSYRPEKAPFALRARVRQEIAAQHKNSGFFRQLLKRPIPAVVTVALLFLMVTVVYQSFKSNQQTEFATVEFHTELVGTLDCVNCYLAKRAHVHNYCKEFGHVPALISETGEVFSFIPNEVSKELQEHLEYLHNEVKITGWVFHQANYIELESFEIQNQTVALGGF